MSENLSYIYAAWFDWSKENSSDYLPVSEVFDEHVIVTNVHDQSFLVPFVGSEFSRKAIFGALQPVVLQYFRFDSSLLWDKLMNGEVEISRSAAGRACCIYLESGETISIVAEGYLEDAVTSSDFLHYTLEEG
jgi:hypothetical protein